MDEEAPLSGWSSITSKGGVPNVVAKVPANFGSVSSSWARLRLRLEDASVNCVDGSCEELGACLEASTFVFISLKMRCGIEFLFWSK